MRIGVPEWHGMIDERALHPPAGCTYHSIGYSDTMLKRLFPSGIKGGFFSSPDGGCDLIEAIVLPVVTDQRWIYSVANFAEPMSFTFRGIPLPKLVRRAILNGIFLKDNLRSIVLWSEAAKESMIDYAGMSNPSVLKKAKVVYPAIARAPDRIKPPDSPLILFSGQFFRKGGMHVVDAFYELLGHFPDLKLRICSDLEKDFVLTDQRLRGFYLDKILNNDSISVGRLPRAQLLAEILPKTSVYVLPSYEEAFGFALLEALAFGVPIVSSDVFAIPEIVAPNKSGFLLPFVENVNSRDIVDGYGIRPLSADVHKAISSWTSTAIARILTSRVAQFEMSEFSQSIARSRFSFAQHNAQMSEIYNTALS